MIRNHVRLCAAAIFLCSFSAVASAQGLGRSIDGSLRWLRQQQSKEGFFGDGVEDTALTLYAYATSPRKFTVWDGPWLRRGLDALLLKKDAKTGAFGTPRETLLTALAIDALKTDLGPEVVRAALKSAADALRKPLPAETTPSSLAEFARTALGENLPPAEPDAKAADALAKQILEKRQQDGSMGDVHETAVNVLLLSRCNDVASRNASKSTAVKKASPLPKLAEKYDLARMRTNAARFLLEPAQRIDGRWGFAGNADLGITGMVLGGLLAIPKAERSPEVEQAIAQGLDTLVAAQKPDGSIHEGQTIAYSTSVAMMALARSEKPAHREAVQKARAFLTALQSDEAEGYGENHKYYGGIGYGGSERPDLSNLQMAMDALIASGAEAKDEPLKKALIFLQRTQNRSESNRIEVQNSGGVFVAGNDGGGIYAPGESAAGTLTLPDGRQTARSYGSMTYALLKGFLYAGLPKEDPRVKAAFDWISKNYTVDENPGFDLAQDPTASQQGLFYYLHTMSKTLDLFGASEIADAQGQAHDWRREIAARLAALQHADGSWVNEQAERWWEGNQVLATAYALQSLEFCR